jgi:uncharacterized repeat protein (TIGR01451 family)
MIKLQNVRPFDWWRMLVRVTSLFFILIPLTPASAQEYLRYQEFIIPGPEQLMRDSFSYLINHRTIGNDIKSVISVTVDADQTVIHYDHWENGYGGSDESIILNRGETHVFESTVRVNPRDPQTITYDGGDRIYVLGGSAFVSRTNWPLNPGTLLAMAFQVYPTQALENSFVMPVGDELAQPDDDLPFADFKGVVLLIQSIEDQNSITITDVDENVLWQGTLNKGECITDPVIHDIPKGARVEGEHPFQAHILTGDTELAIGYEVNGIACIPKQYWHDEYIIPLTSFQPYGEKNNNDTELYLFNPNSSTITIDFQDSTSGSFEIDPLELVAYSQETGHYLPMGSGVSLQGSDIFWGFGYACSGYDQYDWAFELVGTNLLNNTYVVGWAPGDHTKQNNYSAVFLTALGDNVTVYVDYEQDDVVDYQFETSFPEVVRLVDENDHDMTGAKVWAEEKLALIYGAIAGEETPESHPSIDSGYSIIFNTNDWTTQIFELHKRTEHEKIMLADTNRFEISLKSFEHPVSQVVITDSLPPGWSYVSNSGSLYHESTGEQLATEPLLTGDAQGWELVWTLTQHLDVYDSLAISFDAIPEQEITVGENENYVQVACQISEDDMTDEARVSVLVYPGGEIYGKAWYDENNDGLFGQEPPVPDVEVQLQDESGIMVETTLTDHLGTYSFSDIREGTYSVVFEPLTDFYFTKQRVGSDSTMDSDIDRVTGMISGLEFAWDQVWQHIDAGYVDELSSDLQLIKQASATTAELGELFTYTLTLYNHGPDPMVDMVVNDSLSSLLSFESGDPAPDSVRNGHLFWSFGMLPVDSTLEWSYQVRVEDIGEIETGACVQPGFPDLDTNNNCDQYVLTTLYPIELAAFQAIQTADGVEISWVTESETDNLGFHLYRSDEKLGPYETITHTMISGAGNSNARHSYSFLDEGIERGHTYYYKLADIAFDGKMYYHGPIEISVSAPLEYALDPNYPNPFNPETVLRMHVAQEGYGTLLIYNMRGQKVRTLVQENLAAGVHSIVWDGRNDFGEQLSSGIYVAVFQINGFMQKQKMTLLK